jgi:hypothetical protein
VFVAARLLLPLAAFEASCRSDAGVVADSGVTNVGDDAVDGARPSISANPSSLSFAVIQNVEPRQTQNVTITFQGDRVVADYPAGVSAPGWLTVQQNAASNPSGAVFVVGVDASLLEVGEYTTVLRFASDVLFADVPVSLTVIRQPSAVDEFCDAKAEAECQVAARCATDAQACRAQRSAACLQLAATMTSASRAFRPENTLICIIETSSTYASASPITPAERALVDDACNYVFQGSVDPGGACTTKYDCAGIVICDRGRCATAVTVEDGEPCRDPGQVCGPGLTCANDPDPACTAKKELGEACDAINPCLEELRCAGTCLSPLPPGSPCTSDGDCDAAAPYCDPSAGKVCDAGLSFAPGAASCAGYGG